MRSKNVWMKQWLKLAFVALATLATATILPGCAALKSLKSLASGGSSKKATVKKVKSEGATSPTAGKYAGKVVFSKTPIDRGPKDDSSFISEATLFDPIHMRPFFKDSLYNLMAERGMKYRATSPHSRDRFTFRAQINGEADREKWVRLDTFRPGKPMIDEHMTISPNNSGETSLTAAADEKEAPVAFIFVTQALGALKEGDNALTVHVFGRARSHSGDFDESIASGTLTLKIGPGDIAKFWKQKGPSLPASKHPENAKLVKLYAETLKREWKDETFIGAVTTSKNWDVALHRISGRPVQRSVDVSVVLKYKDHDYCRLFDLSFYQKYAGTGQTFHERMTIGVGDNRQFPCEAAPK